MEDITDANYTQTKRVQKYFKIEISGEYHDLYVQSNKCLLADLFKNLQNMCLKIYELDSCCFLAAPGLTWHVPLTKSKIGTINQHRYVINGRKGYQRWNMSCNLLMCKIK